MPYKILSILLLFPKFSTVQVLVARFCINAVMFWTRMKINVSGRHSKSVSPTPHGAAKGHATGNNL